MDVMMQIPGIILVIRMQNISTFFPLNWYLENAKAIWEARISVQIMVKKQTESEFRIYFGALDFVSRKRKFSNVIGSGIHLGGYAMVFTYGFRDVDIYQKMGRETTRHANTSKI